MTSLFYKEIIQQEKRDNQKSGLSNKENQIFHDRSILLLFTQRFLKNHSVPISTKKPISPVASFPWNMSFTSNVGVSSLLR